MTELVTYGSVGGMASNGCLYPETLLKQGVKVWNQWRDENPEVIPDLINLPFAHFKSSSVNLGGWPKSLVWAIQKRTFSMCYNKHLSIQRGSDAAGERSRQAERAD